MPACTAGNLVGVLALRPLLLLAGRSVQVLRFWRYLLLMLPLLQAAWRGVVVARQRW
jgi:hypothetical protein